MPAKRTACATCIHAKTKCVWNGRRCERCLRLNKRCTPDIDLELHQNGQRPKRAKHNASHEDENFGNEDSSQHSISTTSQPQLGQQHSPPSPPTLPKHDVWLTRFRQQMTKRFPFVPVPAHLTAQDLQAEKPVLFNSIMMAACDDPFEQIERATYLRKDLAERIMVRGESSLDILQAILVACAWYHVHLDVNYQITNLLALGTAMLVDLHLNSIPHQEDRRRTIFATEDAPALYYAKNERTLEERRVFLGFQYLCTFVFVLFRRVEIVRNEFYGDQCCEILKLTKQYDTDTYLIYLYQLVKHAQAFGLVLDLNSDNLLLRKSLSSCEQDIVRTMKSDFDTFRNSDRGISESMNLSARAHAELVELYFYELLHQILDRSQACSGALQAGEDSKQRCMDIAPNVIEMAIEMISGPPSSWTWIEIWHQTHSLLVLLKTADSDGYLRTNGLESNNIDKSVEEILQETEMAMTKAGERNSAFVFQDHNIYLRNVRQLRAVRERFQSQQAIDLALRMQGTSQGLHTLMIDPPETTRSTH